MSLALHLHGKRALMNGSSSGIGAIIARRFVAQGVSVVAHSRDAPHVQAISDAVSPGMMGAEVLAAFLTGFAEKRGWGDEPARAEQAILYGFRETVSRIGECDDIAYAMLLLASPRSAFINGTNLHVDGGTTSSLH